MFVEDMSVLNEAARPLALCEFIFAGSESKSKNNRSEGWERIDWTLGNNYLSCESANALPRRAGARTIPFPGRRSAARRLRIRIWSRSRGFCLRDMFFQGEALDACPFNPPSNFYVRDEFACGCKLVDDDVAESVKRVPTTIGNRIRRQASPTFPMLRTSALAAPSEDALPSDFTLDSRLLLSTEGSPSEVCFLGMFLKCFCV